MTSKTKKNAKKVVSILLYRGEKVLMHLRDTKDNIPFPGHWGFLSGGIKPEEKPSYAAIREIQEELNFSPKRVRKLVNLYLPHLNNIFSYHFYCPLTIPFKALVLREGQDLGLFSLKEIESGKLYSAKLKKYLPVVPDPHIGFCVRKLFNHLHDKKNNRQPSG